MSLEKLEALPDELPPIEEKWRDYMRSQIKQFPQNNLRASSIGHVCDRYHYYSIKNWRDREIHDENLQSIFDEGKKHEVLVIQQLQNIGFEIIETQSAFQHDDPLITGHIDGILEWQGKKYPFDVKTTQSWTFNSLNSAEDFLYSDKIYHKNYVAQLQMYLLMTSNPIGCLIMKDKGTGAIKPVWMQIDYAFCENLLKRAERVYKNITAKEPGKRTENLDHCIKCDFKHLCLPEIKLSEGVKIIDDMELEGMIDRREQLSETKSEFDKLDKQIKKLVKPLGEGENICGKYLVRNKEYRRKRLVPSEEEYTMLTTKFLKIDE